MLLPSDESDESEEGPDPREELVARLLEYKRFKEAAGQLRERPLLGRDVFEARGPEPELPPDSEREVEVDLFELVEAYRRVLRQARTPAAAHEIEAESLTVHERMIVVMQILESRESIEFERIFFESEARAPSRMMIVTTFLAVLELTRLAALRLYQGASPAGVPEGPIRVRRTSIPGDDGWAAQLAHV
jgi:segregation and condensation protein A